MALRQKPFLSSRSPGRTLAFVPFSVFMMRHLQDLHVVGAPNSIHVLFHLLYIYMILHDSEWSFQVSRHLNINFSSFLRLPLYHLPSRLAGGTRSAKEEKKSGGKLHNCRSFWMTTDDKCKILESRKAC